jgi:hypothetical protein
MGIVVANKGRATMTAALAQFTDGNSPDGGTALVMTAVSVLSVVFSLLGTMGFFALSAGLLVLLDVLFAQSGRARRLVEFTAYSYLPGVAWSIVTLAVLTFWWTPAPMRVPSLTNINDMQAMIASHQVQLASTPIQITLRIVASFFWAWQIAIQAAALRVVSRFSIAGAWGVGIVLISVFVVLPRVVGG